MKRLAIAAAGLAALAALTATFRTGGAGAADPAPTADRGITVQGTARVSAEPDRAELSLGVETRADTAEAALAANGTRMRAVIAAVKRAGGEEVETQSVWLNPWHDEDGPAGYVATNTVSASIDIAGTGDLIDAATEAGANQVSGPSMTIDDEEDLYRKALQAAVKQARERAEVLAEASGAKLGAVVTVVEGGPASPLPYAMRAEMAGADAATPIEPGKRDITAGVTVTYAIA
jgi:uncharacterized protein YggE